MGAVLHTLNIRLFEDQFTYIVNHAEDAVMLVDEDLLPAVEALADRFPTVRAYVVMSGKKTVPATKLSPAYSYEALLDAETEEYEWPSLRDENAMAALCYTTATTGKPKGVPYSHRGIYLHALAICAADALPWRRTTVSRWGNCSSVVHGSRRSITASRSGRGRRSGTGGCAPATS
jgi:fatty-acyl-CoA synthase